MMAILDDVTIETGRLLLRPWKSDDAEECFKNESDPEIGPNAVWQVHTNIEDSMDFNDSTGAERVGRRIRKIRKSIQDIF